MTTEQPQQTHIKTVNIFEMLGSKWSIVVSVFSVVLAIVGLFYRQTNAEESIKENKEDIKVLEMRVNAVEGDIKAIRQGVDFLTQQAIKQNGN